MTSSSHASDRSRGSRRYGLQGAFYVFADVRQALAEGEDDLAFCQGLLREQAVAAVPGSAFGAPGWLRLSLAASQADLDAAGDRIEAYLNDRG